MLRSLSLILLVLCAASAWADEPRLYLAWHAPYGLPGASDTLSRACGDTSRVDTLFLSFDPGRATRTFVGMTVTLKFQAQPGDSLGPLWAATGAGAPPPWMRVEWAPDSSSGCPSPWTTLGVGGHAYRKDGGQGLMRMVYAVSLLEISRVEPGRRYGLARILLRGLPRGVLGCHQPVCVEWTAATMSYGVGQEYPVDGKDSRVSLNSPVGQVCPPAPEPPWRKRLKPGKSGGS